MLKDKNSLSVWWEYQSEYLNLRLMVAEFRKSVETTSYSSLGARGEQYYIDMILETNKSYLEFLGMNIGK